MLSLELTFRIGLKGENFCGAGLKLLRTRHRAKGLQELHVYNMGNIRSEALLGVAAMSSFQGFLPQSFRRSLNASCGRGYTTKFGDTHGQEQTVFRYKTL